MVNAKMSLVTKLVCFVQEEKLYIVLCYIASSLGLEWIKFLKEFQISCVLLKEELIFY